MYDQSSEVRELPPKYINQMNFAQENKTSKQKNRFQLSKKVEIAVKIYFSIRWYFTEIVKLKHVKLQDIYL